MTAERVTTDASTKRSGTAQAATGSAKSDCDEGRRTRARRDGESSQREPEPSPEVAVRGRW